MRKVWTEDELRKRIRINWRLRNCDPFFIYFRGCVRDDVRILRSMRAAYRQGQESMWAKPSKMIFNFPPPIPEAM